MDAGRFETLLRSLRAQPTRRGMLLGLTGGVLAAAQLAVSQDRATAKHKPPKSCFGPFTVVGALQAVVDSAPVGSTVRLCPGPFTNTGFTIRKNLTIVGAGSDQTVLLGRSPAPGPAVTVAAGTKVTLKGLAVSSNFNGAAQSASTGGGILNQGHLTVTECADNENGAYEGGASTTTRTRRSPSTTPRWPSIPRPWQAAASPAVRTRR